MLAGRPCDDRIAKVKQLRIGFRGRATSETHVPIFPPGPTGTSRVAPPADEASTKHTTATIGVNGNLPVRRTSHLRCLIEVSGC